MSLLRLLLLASAGALVARLALPSASAGRGLGFDVLNGHASAVIQRSLDESIRGLSRLAQTLAPNPRSGSISVLDGRHLEARRQARAAALSRATP